MTVQELRSTIYKIAQDYFGGAVAVWNKQTDRTKPKLPFLSIDVGNVHRTQHEISILRNDEFMGVLPSHVYVTFMLFTLGGKRPNGTIYENTAANDLQDFINYLLSREVDDISTGYDVTFDMEGDVQDLTDLLDNDYQYAARQQMRVMFGQVVRGYADIRRDDWKPTASGGGTEEIASKQIYDIDPEKIEIEEVIIDDEHS